MAFSSNGTFLNGKLIGKAHKARLRTGSIITLSYPSMDDKKEDGQGVIGYKYVSFMDDDFLASKKAFNLVTTTSSLPSFFLCERAILTFALCLGCEERCADSSDGTTKQERKSLSSKETEQRRERSLKGRRAPS
jgi:hypothetical protein